MKIIDFKKLSSSFGYKKLKKDVLKDTIKGSNCFNLNGCNKIGKSNCFHKYCEKFKWVIDRVKHYSYKTKIDPVFILDKWEERRNYWYMSYYQNCNQPKINRDSVRIYENSSECINDFEDKGFVCSSCKKIIKNPYKCDLCGWKVYGLFGHLGLGINIFLKDKAIIDKIFCPVKYYKGDIGEIRRV